MRKLRAFLLRSYRIESSYKLASLLQVASVLVPVLMAHLAGKLIDDGGGRALERYGGRYAPFAVVGIALSQYYTQSLRSASDSLRRAQLSGVLEAILSTRTRPALFILYDSVYGFLAASVTLMITLGIGVLVMGLPVNRANLPTLALAMLLGATAIQSWGVFSAAVTVTFKKGEPIQLLMGAGAALVSGAYFPTSMFPEPVRWLANALPTTHALEAARLAIFAGAGPPALAVPLGLLAAMTVVLLPLSLWCFEAAVTSARRRGTLLHY